MVAIAFTKVEKMDKIEMRSFVLIRKQKNMLTKQGERKGQAFCKKTHQYEYTEDCPLFQVFFRT